MTARFEGSFLGATDKITGAAVMECKICWSAYDPAEGDDFRQIAPGTAFRDLPQDWSCPECGAPKEQFMVLDDPGTVPAEETPQLGEVTARLEAEFREIWHAKMRDLPMVNKLLSVEAVGFCMSQGRPLGVLISPWFMNLLQLPAPGEDWSALIPGTKEVISFPSGAYEFIHNTRDMIGGYKACALFSPMGDFNSQAQARDVAQAVMVALFDDANRADTDRAADIRAAREAELAAPPRDAEPAETAAEEPGPPSRRAVITGGMSGPA